MKLITTDQSELMEITTVRAEGGKLIISGNIMGAMPVQAVLSGAEMRKGYAMLSIGTIWKIAKIFLSGKGI